MESDIVDRLRGGATKDYGCQCPKCEAADEIESLRAELAAAIKQRDEARDYSIALQRAIEHHLRVVAVPPEIAANCPHHARMLNEHLARKEGGGA